MKKALLFILLSAFTLTSFAQNEHLKFQGISIDGSISSFHQKLITKGWEHSELGTKELNADGRVYDGKYFGQKASLYVFYTPGSKTVYSVQVVINIDDEAKLSFKADELKNLFMKKYESSNSNTSTDEEGDPETWIFVPKESGESFVGGICIQEKRFGFDYVLIIDFMDNNNFNKKTDEMISDL